MASVTIDQVRESYGTLEVVHGVSVDIGDGEFVVLVGLSSCGKSTLLRMIAGLEEISGGTIAIGDNVVNELPPKQRGCKTSSAASGRTASSSPTAARRASWWSLSRPGPKHSSSSSWAAHS